MGIFFGSIIGSFIGYLVSLILQERKYKYDLSMVAIERKLEVHQEAYILFFDMSNYPSGDALEIYGRGIKFLRTNALYLTDSAREAIKISLEQLEKCVQVKDNPLQLVKELETLVAQGEKIRQALDLPDVKLSKLQSI